MEFNEVINRRRTVRDFTNKPVPFGIIEHAIENAFKAPTYNHLREWDFVIIGSMETKLKLIDAEKLDKEIDFLKLESLFANTDGLLKEMYLDAIPKQKRMILDAPVTVIVIYKPKTQVEEARTVYDLNCLASVWACIENFLLSLAEHDVYGVTFIPQDTPEMKARLDIPLHLEIAAVIPVGFKAENAREVKQKVISAKERIHFERW
jgi:nitroreductase